jgi:hypothetical protein
MTDVLIECAIFDDGDVLPTVLLMQWPSMNLGKELRSGLRELREVAEQEYGRKAPDHAIFWRAHPEPEETP